MQAQPASTKPQWTCVACGAPYTGPAVYAATCERCGAHEFKRIVDPKTQCPDCGAQLIVNLRGWAEYTCGAIRKGGQVERLCPSVKANRCPPLAPSTCEGCPTSCNDFQRQREPSRSHRARMADAGLDAIDADRDELVAEQRYLESIGQDSGRAS